MRSAILLSVILVLAGILSVTCTNKKKAQTASSAANNDSLTIEIVASDSISVLELLQREHVVEYTSGSMGAFIKAIDSIAGGYGWYWLYAVNDSMAHVAADKRFCRPGDRVTWHFRSAGR